jgi:hypothetical protein
VAKDRPRPDRGPSAKRAPRTSRGTPPDFVVTSTDAADLTRMRARDKNAERVLRDTGDPWAALAVLGIKGKRPGRRPRTRQESERVAGLFINMCTAPGPCRPNYPRTPERLDLLLSTAAEAIDAQREGRPIPALPDAALFVPDRDVPMEPPDALRNTAMYLGGVGLRQAWEVLHAERKYRRANPVNPIDDQLLEQLLPPRPAPNL